MCGVAGMPASGYIRVNMAGCAGDCFIGKAMSSHGRYGVTKSLGVGEDRLLVQFLPTDPPFHILTMNGADPGHYLLGGIRGNLSPDSDLVPGSFSYVYLGGIAYTAPLATPMVGGNSYEVENREIEASIWSFRNAGMFLVPNWVNSDGNFGTVQIIHDIDGFLALVGDAGAYERKFSVEVQRIDSLQFVSE